MSLSDLIAEARSQDLLAIPEQDPLTERYVRPVWPEILEAARDARSQADAHFRQLIIRRGGRNSISASGEADLTTYPVGLCGPIRDLVYARLNSLPLIQSLRAYGVVVKKVFLIREGRYFQNAIQVGHFYLDVANDTCDPTQPAIEWWPIAELDYTLLESWQDLADVAEAYYHCRVYPNVHFPLLAPLSPLYALRDNGRLDLLDFQNIFFLKDLGDGLPRLQAWLAGHGPVLDRALPPSLQQRLHAEFQGNDFEAFPFEYRPCSRQEVSAQAQEIAQAALRPDQESLVLTLLRLAPKATAAFRARNIRAAPWPTAPP